MARKGRKPGIDQNFLMTRRLQVKFPTGPKKNQATAEIARLAGVGEVSWRRGGDIIEIVYDATRRQLADIEGVLSNHGCVFGESWWLRFRRSWYRFTDENVRANAMHVPQCCNKPPV